MLSKIKTKICKGCGKTKHLDSFGKYKARKDGKCSKCKECYNKEQRVRRALNKNASTKKYEKTKRGFLMRVYRNMLSRVSGTQRRTCTHEGLDILAKEEFYKWSLNNPDFHELFDEWESADHRQNLVPSIDRIDPREGYYLMNMQWVTISENVKRHHAFMNTGRII